MAIPNSFDTYGLVRLPPDQNGKRLVTGTFVVLEWNTGTAVPITGDIVTGNTTGVRGVVDFVYQLTGTTGYLTCVLDLSFPYSEDEPFQTGETLSIEGSTTSANWSTVAESQLRHLNANVILSLDNPRNALKIDAQGSAYVRYTEGEQQLDAFGLARGSAPELLAQYQFMYDELPLEFQKTEVGTGVVNYLTNESTIQLQCPVTSGDSAQMRTHRYHPYHAGFGTHMMMTVAIGDTGKTNVVRRWGYFDDNDGYFFQLSGTDLSVVRRTSTSGSPVETTIPQADWNTNTVDTVGVTSNPSDMVLDITKVNIWWLDIQWLGGGNVRMGVFSPEGDRVILHKFKNAGSLTTAHTKRGALPVTVEQVNTGVSASTSEMRFVCATVQIDGALPRDHSDNGFLGSADTAGYVNAPASNAEVHLLSVRPVTTLSSKENRKITVPNELSLHVKTNPVKIRLLRNATITTPSYSALTDSSTEIDIAGTYTTSTGEPLKTWLLDVGDNTIHLDQHLDSLSRSLYLGADGSVFSTYTFVVSSIASGSAAEVYGALNYIDIG